MGRKLTKTGLQIALRSRENMRYMRCMAWLIEQLYPEKREAKIQTKVLRGVVKDEPLGSRVCRVLYRRLLERDGEVRQIAESELKKTVTVGWAIEGDELVIALGDDDAAS